MTLTTLIPKDSTILLSSGSIMPWEIPAYGDQQWPLDARCWTVFRNTAGAVLAEVEAEDITATRIRYIFRPDGDQSVTEVPAGARFESFIELDDGPFKLRYGIVQRAEARFADTPPTAIGPPTGQARMFSDSFVRAAPGWKWEKVYGATKIWNESPFDTTPIGLGANTDQQLGKAAAVRYYRPLAGDSPEVAVTIQMPAAIGVSNGKTRIIFAADQNQRAGLAMELDSVNDQVHMARVVAPDTVAYVGSAASGVGFVDNDLFTARYNNLTDTLAVYRATSSSPMVAPWVDTAHTSPHGNGYRYLHLAWAPTLLETGPLVSGWSAKDSV
jgi:hypothetical protein